MNFKFGDNLSEVEKGYIVDTTHQKGDAEINSMFDSRRFDEIVMGAVIVTMQNLNSYNNSEIDDILYEMRRGTFGLYDGEALRKAFKNFKA